jgi:nucleoside-diphosphate-sugar epimerase
VDVRDVAQAHVLAVESPAANGHRVIIAPQKVSFPSEYVKALRTLFSDRPLPVIPELLVNDKPKYLINTDASERTLGSKYRSLERTIEDTSRSLLNVADRIKDQARRLVFFVEYPTAALGFLCD